jgi:hypothetical protein
MIRKKLLTYRLKGHNFSSRASRIRDFILKLKQLPWSSKRANCLHHHAHARVQVLYYPAFDYPHYLATIGDLRGYSDRGALLLRVPFETFRIPSDALRPLPCFHAPAVKDSVHLLSSFYDQSLSP